MIIDRQQLVAALPQYEIGDVIGRGAHGLVVAARHRRLGTTHAVKALAVAEADLASASRRFLTEARVMTSLDHPHIVRVNEYAEHGGTLLLVMEHLGGGTLIDRARDRVTPEAASAWMLAVAEALAVAHRQGVVHRDIKPANLLFTADGLLKVGDFGIAKLFAGSDASASADIVGTPRYIAPEQISGGRTGPGTDLYALGVTFYELLTGRPPFPADLNMPGLLHHHLSVPPRPPDGVSPALAALVLRLLAKDPADRPETARDFARALVEAADEDLGHDWIARSGVPLRIDGALLYRDRTPVPPFAKTIYLAEQPPLPPIEPDAPPSGEGARAFAARGAGGVARFGRAVARRERSALVALGVVLAVLVAGVVFVVARPDGSATVTAAPTASPVRTVAPPTATLLGQFYADSTIAGVLATNEDASRVAWVATDGGVKIWQPRDAHQVTVGGTGDAFWAVAFAASADPGLAGDGGLLLTGGQDGWIRQWDPANGQQAGAFTAAGGPEQTMAVAFDGDGSTMAAGGSDGTVRIWNAITAETEDPPLRGHTSPIAAIAFAPTRDRVATAADDGVRIWSRGSHQQVAYRPNAKGAVTTSLMFSPDGHRLAAGGLNNVVRLWDPKTGNPVGAAIEPGLTDSLALGFTRDSRRLVTVAGNSVRRWDVTTGAQVGEELTLHLSAPAVAAALTPDGTRVVIAASDGSVRLYRIS
ncbi:WD40 repeat domain-containing serine/threonine protein kinase [Cryptosporangium phraense]|uniref:non-specific serine/threonine protein kinase n=1 Tax=Cryptosporangium phraense TaxID=2593070 RepID=A0A545ATW5_9ACTN|nr:serine/threonine-protein kinase [Cryptosporangium phraense]TQS44779.1 protein kinase [Cryptosporangium phraense]